MNSKFFTTPEEGIRLLGIGLNPKTADMSWVSKVASKTSGFELVKNDINAYSGKNFNEPIPAWSAEALLNLIPSVIYRPDPSTYDPEDPDMQIPVVREWQWKMWRNPRKSIPSSRNPNGSVKYYPAKYGMTYEAFSILPSNHPISPCAPNYINLFGDDGNHLIWSDESLVKVCIKAIEWLVSHDHQLNTLF